MAGLHVVGDGVADLGVGNILDVGDEESDFAGRQFLNFHRLGREHAEGLHLEAVAIPHQANLLPLLQYALNHAGEHHYAAIRIEPGVEDQRLKLVGRASLGRRNLLHDGFENFRDALAGLGADRHRMGSVEAHRALDHFFGALDVGAGQIDLVDDGNDFQPVVDRDVRVGQRLCLDALRRVNHQQRALARRQRARNFVAEVHVSWRVDQVELVGLAVGRGIHHANRMRLDGDSPLPLQVHRVEHLLLHLARRQASRSAPADGRQAYSSHDRYGR